MPTMAWNRVEGFDGNEARLGERPMNRNSRELGEDVKLLSERDYAQSQFYQEKGSHTLTTEELDKIELHDGESMRPFQDDQTAGHGQRKKPWVILPDSRFRKIWINVQLFVVLYIIWVTPVRVGFDKPAVGFWFWLEGIIDIFFYTDLTLNFFTAYEHPVTGELVTSHRKIALRYLRTWFAIDLLATFPTDYIVRGVEGTWTCSVMGNCDLQVHDDTAASLVVMLRLLRIFRILWIFKNFNVLSISTVLGRLQDEFYAARWAMSLIELLIVLVFLGHLSGCFFYFFSGPSWWTEEERTLIENGELSTWVLDKMGGYYTVVFPRGPFNATTGFPDGFPLPPAAGEMTAEAPAGSGQWFMCTEFFAMQTCGHCDAPKLRCVSDFGFTYRYITSMYWAYTTMTTVGYGDIYGTTIAEKVWCMITMVIGGFFLSFCFGRMASVVSRLDADKVQRSEQMHELSSFMKDVELPRVLARKVIEYNKKQKVRGYDRQAVLARLPFELRSKILRHLYLPTIAQVPLLQAMSHDDVFLTDLCVRLQPMHFSADTFVYMLGEPGADVYILLQGDLEVLESDQNSLTLLYRVPEGNIFGESEVMRYLTASLGHGHSSAASVDEAGGAVEYPSLSKVKRRTNVFCRSPCDMLRIPEEDIMDLCEHYPALYKGLRQLDRLRQKRVKEVLDAKRAAQDGPSTSYHLPSLDGKGKGGAGHGHAGMGLYTSLATHGSTNSLGMTSADDTPSGRYAGHMDGGAGPAGGAGAVQMVNGSSFGHPRPSGAGLV